MHRVDSIGLPAKQDLCHAADLRVYWELQARRGNPGSEQVENKRLGTSLGSKKKRKLGDWQDEEKEIKFRSQLKNVQY